MAYQQSGSKLMSTAIGPQFVGTIKFKVTNAANGTVSILKGAELVNTITMTTNTNAAVATVTLNCNLPDVEDASSDWRDDGQAGFWCSTGNITGENTNSNTACTLKIGFFNAGGTTVTTNNVNANAAVVGVTLYFLNNLVDKGN